MDTHSSQNYSTQVETALDCLIDMHLQASQTYISLSLYFVGGAVAQKDVGHFFNELAEKKYKGAHHLLMQSRRGSPSLCQIGQRVPQDEWCNRLAAMKAAIALEKNLHQARLDLHALAWANADCRLCNFLVSHFLEDEMKIIQKMGDHLTNLRQQAIAEAVLSESLSKLSLNHS